MSYGEHLEKAAAGLARAHAALRDPPPDPADRASAAVSRVRLYRALERQVVMLGDLRAADLPPAGERPAPHHPSLTSRRPVMALAVWLRYAPAGTIAANPGERIDLPATGTVAVALREAYQALQTAGDILTSNTGARTGPGESHRPLTTDGMAVLAGVGRSHNLAAVARLAANAAMMDIRMTRWLWPDDAPTDLRPMLAAAEQDAWQTRNSPLHEMALRVTDSGDGQQAPVLGMTPAPPVDDPLRWTQPNSLPGCVDALDAARSWLARNGHELTIGQLATTAQAALAITHYVGYIHTHLSPTDSDLSTVVAEAARPWRGVLQAVAELRSPVPTHGDHSTLSVASAGAAAWLGDRLRPDGQWRSPPLWTGEPAGVTAWRDAAAQITARMPDLADLLQHAVGTAHARGGVLAATGRLNRHSRSLVHAPEWAPPPADHRSYRALRTALSNAAAQARRMARAVGVAPRAGVAAARRQLSAEPSPAHLAGQWYPPTTQPGTPPTRATPEKAPHRQPGRALPSADRTRRRR